MAAALQIAQDKVRPAGPSGNADNLDLLDDGRDAATPARHLRRAVAQRVPSEGVALAAAISRTPDRISRCQ